MLGLSRYVTDVLLLVLAGLFVVLNLSDEKKP